MDAPTETGVQGIDESVLRRAGPFVIVTHTTTAARYEGIDTWTGEVVIGKFDVKAATLTLTDSIIANTSLLSSLERAIERLEPGKLLTDKDVFGDEADGGAD